jgi:hypothetical protein
MKCPIARLRGPKAWAAAALLLSATDLSASSAAAQEPSPPQAPSSPPNEVRFDPDDPDVTLLSLSSTVPVERVASYNYERWYALYGPICQGPCTAHLMPGAYRLALTKGGRVVPVSGPVILNGPATLRGQYIDRSALRATGLVIGVAGAVGGFVMVVASAQTGAVCGSNGICVSNGKTDVPLLATGVAVLVVSAVVGSILTFQPDRARITVEPLVLPGHASREALTALGPSQPQGAAVALHF